MTKRLKTPKNAPTAARNDFTWTAHGEKWVDPYAWLRPDNWQEVLKDPTTLSADITGYLNAENEYHDATMATLKPLQDEIAAEIRGRMPDKVESIPVPDAPYKYQDRIDEGAKYPIYVRTNMDGTDEEIIFDSNAAANGFDYFDIGQVTHSPDHTQLIWSCDTRGSEFYTLYIRNIRTGVDNDYCIENMCDADWADSQTVFYTRLNRAGRSHQVYKHLLGSNPEHDVLIFHEEDERYSCDVHTSLSRQFVFIQIGTFDEDEWWYIPVNDLSASPVLIQARMKGVEYEVQHQGNRFVISTNADNAIDGKLVETPIENPSKDHWVDLIPHQSGRMMVGFTVYQDWIVWLESVNALGQIGYMDKDGNIRRVLFDEEAYSLGIDDHFGYKSSSMLFQYSSPTTPWESYEFNLFTQERALLKRQIIPSGHDPRNYVTRRFCVESHDSVQVPVTLLYRRDTPIDGTAPALLYGYGCYGASSTVGFDSSLLSLVDRGFVYAIAHVRGGSEKGGAWYEDAKVERKVNSFHDFIAVGDALVEQGFCAAEKIVSEGGSAGGLLVAASMNMKPELFVGVIADVPDVDVLNLMLDSTLPGVPVHWSEWGNPITSKTAFDSIKSYSPYENTVAGAYPSLYVTAGVSDTRVFFWQPAKWVANLRDLKTDDNAILFKTNMQSGHFGNTGRFAHIAERARSYTFAIAVTDI